MPELERIEAGNGSRPGFVARLDRLISAAAELLSTRSQILGEELSQKGKYMGRGVVAAAVAATLGFLAFLLLAGLIAAFFARILGSAWAGVLAALVLYAAGAVGAAILAVRSFARVRPLDFPVTSREIARDWEAVRRAAGVAPAPEASRTARTTADAAPAAEGFEERLREGWE